MINHNNKNETSTFFIYDYETFGKNPALDRPAQFAGIRTDHNFNPINKPEIFYCCLPNDYLPNPEATLLTEIDPMNSLNIGIREYKFAQYIHKIFSIPKTCILGYNNIRFDNEFSRNIFYRNFFDPYTWSWQQKNSIWDLLHIMRAYYALRPEGIKWPLNNKGYPSFRLQDLSKNNNITHNKIHDALSDVYATLELTKLVKHTQPKLFNYLYHYRQKKELKKLINFKKIQPLIYVPTKNIIKNHYAILICPLTWNSKNPNILIAYNLHKNLNKLWTINNNTILYDPTIKNCDHNEHIILTIHINKCPILTPINALRTQDIARLNINLQYCLDNFKKLKKYMYNNIQLKKIITEFQENFNYISKNTNQKLHVDNQLYQGFFNKSDQYTINMIQKTVPEILTKLHINFHDKRLKSLLFYYRSRNFPHTLTQHEKKNWLEYRKTLFTEKKLTYYNQQLHDLFKIHKQNVKKIKILNSLTKYLEYINKSINNKIN